MRKHINRILILSIRSLLQYLCTLCSMRCVQSTTSWVKWQRKMGLKDWKELEKKNRQGTEASRLSHLSILTQLLQGMNFASKERRLEAKRGRSRDLTKTAGALTESRSRCPEWRSADYSFKFKAGGGLQPTLIWGSAILSAVPQWGNVTMRPPMGVVFPI